MTKQGDMLPVSLAEQIAEVERELVLRERVYPRWTANNQLSERAAAQQLRCLRAVLDTLLGLRATSDPTPAPEVAP